MKSFIGPESIAYGDIIAGTEAKIPAPLGAAWRKRNWFSHVHRRNNFTHTELNATEGALPNQQPNAEKAKLVDRPTEEEKPTSPPVSDSASEAQEGN